MRKIIIKVSCITIFAFLLFSCGSNSFTPKPRGLNYIELPEHTFSKLDVDSIPYHFEHSKHAQVVAHHNRKEEQIIDYGNMKAKVWLTYFPINQQVDSLESYIYASYRLLQKHNVKADAIINDTIQTTDGRTATVFYLEGEVPSAYQFYIHDSTTNFMRGAMYFETATKNDSLQPIYDFVLDDMRHLLETLEWKK